MREVAPGLGWCESDGAVGAFALAFPAGFHTEGADRPGLAHFTEHMLMAPRDEHMFPYAQLEEDGFLLEAQTRRDHLTVTVSGPQEHLLRAVETLVAHLTDRSRPATAPRQQAEIIHNEVLEKTGLAPWADRWRWHIPASAGAGIGVGHDPVVAPALAGLAVHEDAWKGFAADHVRLDRCSAAVVADPVLVRSDEVESVLGPRSVPEAVVTEAVVAAAACRPRHEIVLPVPADDLAGQSAALIAAKVTAAAVAADHLGSGGHIHYGLFDEWFSENAPTAVSVPLPVGLDVTTVERQLRTTLRTVSESRSVIWARDQLSKEWAARTESPSACARLMAWMLLGGRMDLPFTRVDRSLVERSVSQAVVLGSV